MFQEFIGCHSWRYPKNEQLSGLPRKDGDDFGWVRTLRRLGGGRAEGETARLPHWSDTARNHYSILSFK